MLTPYRGRLVDREFRRIQRKRDRRDGPARQASLARREVRREERRKFRRFLLVVVATTFTLCALKDLFLYLLHK